MEPEVASSSPRVILALPWTHTQVPCSWTQPFANRRVQAVVLAVPCPVEYNQP